MSEVEHVHPSWTIHPESLSVVTRVPNDAQYAVTKAGEVLWEKGRGGAAGPGCEFACEDVELY